MDNCKNCNVKTTLILWMKYYAMLGKQHGDIFKKLTKNYKSLRNIFSGVELVKYTISGQKIKVIYVSLA